MIEMTEEQRDRIGKLARQASACVDAVEFADDVFTAAHAADVVSALGDALDALYLELGGDL